MSERVTLPKEVAEAIENYKNRKNHHWKQHLLGDISHSSYDNMWTDVKTIFDWKRKGQGNFDTLLSALVNGYEVEERPQITINPTEVDGNTRGRVTVWMK